MDTSSVGTIDDYIPMVAPPPSSRETETQGESETRPQETVEDSGKLLDLYA
jgi:hypothetical protein